MHNPSHGLLTTEVNKLNTYMRKTTSESRDPPLLKVTLKKIMASDKPESSDPLKVASPPNVATTNHPTSPK